MPGLGKSLDGHLTFAVFVARRYTAVMAAKLQFSLRWLFAVIAMVAVVAAEAAAFSPQTALVVGFTVSVLAPAALVAGIAYAKAGTRAFCIGAVAAFLASRVVIIPGSIPGLGLMSIYSQLLQWWPIRLYMGDYRAEYILSWILACVGGLVAVFVRWLTMPKLANKPPRSGDGI